MKRQLLATESSSHLSCSISCSHLASDQLSTHCSSSEPSPSVVVVGGVVVVGPGVGAAVVVVGGVGAAVVVGPRVGADVGVGVTGLDALGDSCFKH